MWTMLFQNVMGETVWLTGFASNPTPHEGAIIWIPQTKGGQVQGKVERVYYDYTRHEIRIIFGPAL